MLRDIRPLALLFFTFALTACGGGGGGGGGTFQTASGECAADVIPKRFLVQYVDGTTEVVEAESKDDFIDGFLEKNRDRIAFAEHDFRVRGVPFAGNPGVNKKAAFADNWGPIRVGVESLWQQNLYGADVIVAVVDTGVDIEHPQLRDRIVVNLDETGVDERGRNRATNGVDDDGNGFIDDAYGYNFAKDRGLTGDNDFHGTHVAGIIAAEHNDSQARAAGYVQGLAPKAKILPVAFLGEGGNGNMSNGVAAIKYAVLRGAKVINASWGGSACSRTLREVIRTLADKGVAFVSASGNEELNIDRSFMYPASFNLPGQITVGATGQMDSMARYSNYGVKNVHIFAPGTLIVSTFPGGEMMESSGTSMATPFVAGAIAILMGAEPTATVDQIREALFLSAYHNPSYLNASQGRLDLTTALTELRALLAP
ncbi:MAG TPA: S8 family peptidase [Bdellovibrionales bacterium]|nr:S8 family peptidase [Bdellovibrionales bacterium]